MTLTALAKRPTATISQGPLVLNAFRACPPMLLPLALASLLQVKPIFLDRVTPDDDLVRLDRSSFDPMGSTLFAIQSGQTWYFQAWYRDSSGGSATSIFSSGLAMTFRWESAPGVG